MNPIHLNTHSPRAREHLGDLVSSDPDRFFLCCGWGLMLQVLGTLSKKLIWNTPPLARLRVLLHSALRPSAKVATYTAHVQAGIEAFAARKRLRSTSFVGLQLPLGDEWGEYCRQQQLSLQTSDWRKCDVPSNEVSHQAPLSHVPSPLNPPPLKSPPPQSQLTYLPLHLVSSRFLR